jgi:hypothetical protein
MTDKIIQTKECKEHKDCRIMIDIDDNDGKIYETHSNENGKLL